MKSKILFSFLIATLILTGVTFGAQDISAKSKVFELKVWTYNTKAALNWYTEGSFYSELHYGQSDKYGASITRDRRADWHSYEITGLTPGTKYYYKIVLKQSKNGQIYNDETTGTFETGGRKPYSQVYKPYFFLNFNNDFYSHNNQYPSEIKNMNGLKMVEPAVWQGKALQVKDRKSHLTYKCDPVFNSGYGTLMAWIRIEDFDDDMVVWQTNDSRYALYYQQGRNWNRIVARAGWDEKLDGEVEQEAKYYFNTSGSGSRVWQSGEWHLVGMVWQGKINGTVKLYIDGEMRAKANYTNSGGCRSFMVGNNYRHNMNWMNGQIDDLKIFDYDLNSTAMRNEFNAYNWNQRQDITGRVAGASARWFKDGKILKAPDGKIYVISRGKRLHISGPSALARFGSHSIINVNWDEIGQYEDSGQFNSWSKFPDGTLLKVYGRPDIYWVWNGQAGAIFNESVFYKYGNIWQDVIEITAGEFEMYPVGPVYR